MREKEKTNTPTQSKRYGVSLTKVSVAIGIKRDRDPVRAIMKRAERSTKGDTEVDSF